MKKSEVVVAEPVVVEALPVFEECTSPVVAERVRFHLAHAREHGRCALAHIIEAGRELALQKQLIGYGQWVDWCHGNLEISQQTADKYIATFQKTIGFQRTAQGVSLDKKILKKELEAATVGMEEKTVRQAMIEIGVIKPAGSWGGKRKGAGRPAASENDVLSDSDAATVMWRESMMVFEKDRPAFISAARDLRADVAEKFLAELEILVDALRERVKEGARK